MAGKRISDKERLAFVFRFGGVAVIYEKPLPNRTDMVEIIRVECQTRRELDKAIRAERAAIRRERGAK